MAGIATALLDALFPRTCPLCGKPSDREGRLLCWECFASLPFRTQERAHCVRCGKTPEGAVGENYLCDACMRHPPVFDAARSALPFKGTARKLVHELKYKKGTWLRRDLADVLLGCVEANFDAGIFDLVVPSPLHSARFQLRGFNQSEFLAEALARRLRIPCGNDLVARIRNTPSQTRMKTAAERRENVKGAFEARRPELVRGRTLLVVDDVMTTGATLNEIAKALKAAGAWRVFCATLARD
jgi:ComF family protein